MTRTWAHTAVALVVGAVTGASIPCSTSSATQVFVSGNDLLARCAPTGTTWSSYCFGYVSGIADAMATEGQVAGWSVCFPSNVVVGQAVDVTVRYLQQHPESRHSTASSLTARALATAFPCR